eukprot:3565180-Amphidinium_carterae.1
MAPKHVRDSVANTVALKIREGAQARPCQGASTNAFERGTLCPSNNPCKTKKVAKSMERLWKGGIPSSTSCCKTAYAHTGRDIPPKMIKIKYWCSILRDIGK